MNKNKIYKILKIIGQVFVIAFACLGLVVSVVAIVQRCNGSIKAYVDTKTEQLAIREDEQTINKKGLIDVASSQYFLSSSDISWDKFYYGVLHDLGAYWSYDYAQSYLVYYDRTNNFEQVGYINVRYASADNNNNALDIANWPTKSLDAITIKKDYLSPTCCDYTLIYSWTHSSSSWSITFHFKVYHNLYVNGADTTGYVNIEQSYFIMSNYPNNEYPVYYQWTLEFTNAQSQYNMVKWFCQNSISYEDGYADGVNVGSSIGYSNGYTDGYNEGYASGNTGMTANPFNLIKNAFSGIASILNIQVIPGLPLGVLIFTPLIITIIIVVIKMIRG